MEKRVLLDTLVLVILFIGVLLFGCTNHNTPNISNILSDRSGQDNCKTLANSLIPKYIPVHMISLSFTEPTTGKQEVIYWKDGSIAYDSPNYIAPLGLCFRPGQNKGENINYLYYGSLVGTNCHSWSYSKQILDKNGSVLGYREFAIQPTIIPTNFSINASSDSNMINVVWENFNSDILTEAFGVSVIQLKVIRTGATQFDPPISEITVCEKNITETNGSFNCDIRNALAEIGQIMGPRVLLQVTPDVKDNKIYEIIDPDIVSCSWVTDQGKVIQ